MSHDAHFIVYVKEGNILTSTKDVGLNDDKPAFTSLNILQNMRCPTGGTKD